MNKVELKCGGYVYVEPFEDYEEEERCKIYDENMVYLDYYAEVYEIGEYNDIINRLKNIDDIHEYLSDLYRSYVYGHTIEEVIDNYIEAYFWKDAPEYRKEIYTEMLNNRLIMTEQEWCEEYMVNKIGNYYFYGED